MDFIFVHFGRHLLTDSNLCSVKMESLLDFISDRLIFNMAPYFSPKSTSFWIFFYLLKSK